MKKLSQAKRWSVCLRHQFLQGSWNFERMQNGGWAYAILPALKELYTNQEDYEAAVKRHLEFYNTHPYVSAPIMGIILSLEERKANGEDISDQTIQDMKVGLMGPLAGVGDPVFWFTLRPILAAVCASLALAKNMFGPLLFFIAWNVIRIAFLWMTQEMGYKKGIAFVDDLSDGFLKKVSLSASMVGMFVIGILVQRFVNIPVTFDISTLFPGLFGLILFFISMKVLKKGMSPVLLIVVLFILCVALSALGILVI